MIPEQIEKEIQAEAAKLYPPNPDNYGFEEDGREIVRDGNSEHREVVEQLLREAYEDKCRAVEQAWAQANKLLSDNKIPVYIRDVAATPLITPKQ